MLINKIWLILKVQSQLTRPNLTRDAPSPRPVLQCARTGRPAPIRGRRALRGLALPVLACCLLGLAGAGAEEATSVDDLFGLDAAGTGATPPATPEAAPGPAPAPGAAGGTAAEPATTDDLFGLPAAATAEPEAPRTTFFGFFQSELAYNYARPAHWQKFRNTVELGAKGRFDNGMRWVMSGRLYVDPVFAFEDFYNDRVRRDRDFEATLRETYVDTTLGGWDLRLGRQQVVWGEMVALFFADVVSARDLREFVLPDFDLLRLPQWAARAEYFSGNFKGELLWIPYFTYDDIGKPGDDYFPFVPPAVPGFVTDVRGDRRPADELDHGAYGARATYLIDGWDMAAFYYTAPSLSPAFSRTVIPGPVPTLYYRSERNREHQVGATLAKDFGPVVMKGEMVYTANRLFETTDPRDSNGVTPQNFLSYIIGAEFAFASDTRLTLQAFQTRVFDHNPGIAIDETETGLTVLVSTRWFHPDVEPEVIYVTSLDQTDSMLQARIAWDFRTDWRATVGADIFTGQDTGIFGRFEHTDRVYSELRYSF